MKQQKFFAWMLACLLLFGTAAFLGCEDDDDDDETGLAGIWRHTIQGVEEETAYLHNDGTYDVVWADMIDEYCESIDGTWESTADSLFTTGSGESETDRMAYELNGNSLSITDDGGTRIYTRISDMVSCDDYDFGGTVTTWTGTLTADVDGVTTEFAVYPYGEISSGVAGFGANNGSQALQFTILGDTPGSYTLGTTTMGIYVPDNTNPTNVFTTVTGIATGTIDFTALSATHIEGTFSFEAVNVQVTPMETVSITNGVVDLVAE